MPPTLKKWGTYWFRLVRMFVCLFVCVYGASKYRLKTSCMDSSWKNSRRIFFVFPELSPLVKLRPLTNKGMKFCKCRITKSIIARNLKPVMLIGDDDLNIRQKLKKNSYDIF